MARYAGRVAVAVCFAFAAAAAAMAGEAPQGAEGGTGLSDDADAMLSMEADGLDVRIDPATNSIRIHDGPAVWNLRGSHGGIARLTLLEAEQTSVHVAPPVKACIIGGPTSRVAWTRPDARTVIGAGALPEIDLRFTLTFAVSGPRRLACTIALEGTDTGRVADVAFPPCPALRDLDARLVFPQWLGLLVAPGGPDMHVRRMLYQRPWCMRFVGGFQSSTQGPRSFIAIIDDSLYRGADFWRANGEVGFDYWGDRSFPERTSGSRTQSLTFEFLDGNYVQVAKRYRDWAQRQPNWTTLSSRFRPCDPSRVGGAVPFCHVPCDYGGEPVSFETFIPRLHALKAAGVHRAIVHLGGWNRRGYDAEYPDILPANPSCGGDESMARLVSAIREVGYICAPHDDVGIMAEGAPSYDEKWLARWFDGTRIDGGVYRDAQNYVTSGRAQAHFAQRNMPQVAGRYPELDAYLFDVTTSVQPLEDYSTAPPTLRADDLAHRLEAFRAARAAFARFTMGESIIDWSIPYNDCAFMAEEGYVHRGDGGWAKDDLHGEIVPLWELVYHDVQIALRDASTHVNTEMDTQDPLIRYLRVFLKTLRAGTAPPALFSDDLTLNVMREIVEGGTDDVGGWSGLNERELLATVSCLSTWLADQVFTAEMKHHEFPDGDLCHEYTRFETPRGTTEVWVNTALEGWSPKPGLMLAPLGFWIQGPELRAYHAETVSGVLLPTPTMLAMRGPVESGGRVEAYRAFGSPEVVAPLESGCARFLVDRTCETVSTALP